MQLNALDKNGLKIVDYFYNWHGNEPSERRIATRWYYLWLATRSSLV